MLIKVRDNNVSFIANGKEIISYDTDYQELSRNPRLNLPDLNGNETLGFAAYGGPIYIQKYELRPVLE